MGRFAIAIFAIVVGIAGMTSAIPASAASWDSFSYAALSGVSVIPAIATGVYSYDVSLDPGATMSLDGVTYQINWIGAFYVRSTTKDEFFGAEDSGLVTDWTWDASPNGSLHDVAGWTAQGNSERVFEGQSKNLQFGSLDVTGVDVDPGFHLGYWDGRQERTGFFYGNMDIHFVQPVPEPSGLQAALMLMTGAGGLAIRRQRRK